MVFWNTIRIDQAIFPDTRDKISLTNRVTHPRWGGVGRRCVEAEEHVRHNPV